MNNKKNKGYLVLWEQLRKFVEDANPKVATKEELEDALYEFIPATLGKLQKLYKDLK